MNKIIIEDHSGRPASDVLHAVAAVHLRGRSDHDAAAYFAVVSGDYPLMVYGRVDDTQGYVTKFNVHRVREGVDIAAMPTIEPLVKPHEVGDESLAELRRAIIDIDGYYYDLEEGTASVSDDTDKSMVYVKADDNIIAAFPRRDEAKLYTALRTHYAVIRKALADAGLLG